MFPQLFGSKFLNNPFDGQGGSTAFRLFLKKNLPCSHTREVFFFKKPCPTKGLV